MLVQTVGEKLRQARVRKGLQVSDLELLTGLDSHLILIMELDQFDLLPEENYRSYLATFAEAVGLNAEAMLKQSDAERFEKPSFSYDHANDSDVEESNLFTDSVRASRRQRQQHRRSAKGFVWLLLFLALSAVLFLAYRFLPTALAHWQQSSQPQVEKVAKPKEETSQPVEQEVKPEEPAKATISVEGEGNYLTARVQTNHYPVTVDFALDGAESSWVALTNSDLGEAGILLDVSTQSYQTRLWDGTSTALISLGVSRGVTVKINDVPLDLSLLATGDLAYITLVLVADQPVQ